MQQAVKTMLICSLAAVPCVPPETPNIAGAGLATDTEIVINVSGGPVAGAIRLIIYYGTTPGGPYPNSQSFDNPITGHEHVTGLTPGTTYYFIAKWDAGNLCFSAASNQVSEATTGGTASHILTEGGDILATENGLELVTES